MALQKNETHDFVELLASGARTATSAGAAAVRLPAMVNSVAFTCDVTVDESAATDLLDVYIQVMLDGSKWTDVVHFPQHLGNAGAKRYIEKITASPVLAGFEVGTALAAGAVRDLLGDEYRTRYVVDDGSGSASFTFSITAQPM